MADKGGVMIPEIIKASSIPLAILTIGLLVWRAIEAGIDGALLMSAFVVIGGLAGYKIKETIEKKKANSQSKEK